MHTAFILLNVEPGNEDEIVKNLKKIPEVEYVFRVYGVYDVIARMEAETIKSLKQIISSRIRRLDKVRSTMTMIVMD